uniref:Uncharacterized protein n=1 Tax=Knipowitschia caucasica TaxID=637954 RepID=A0AAV2J225_KNICA
MAGNSIRNKFDSSKGPQTEAPQSVKTRMLKWGSQLGVEKQGSDSSSEVIRAGKSVSDGPKKDPNSSHQAEPDQAYLTMGLVILKCHPSGRHKVGVIYPGQPPSAEPSWRDYRPGGCCLCHVEVFTLLWEGERRFRNLRSDHQEPDKDEGVELAGACRVSFCSQCWEKFGAQTLATRQDSHEDPCRCRAASVLWVSDLLPEWDAQAGTGWPAGSQTLE